MNFKTVGRLFAVAGILIAAPSLAIPDPTIKNFMVAISVALNSASVYCANSMGGGNGAGKTA